MIELTMLEVVLLLAVGVLLYLYFRAIEDLKAQNAGIAILLYGLHTGKLKIINHGESFKVEPT